MRRKKVVIVGAGFGGLAAAKALSGRDVAVTLIDRTNHHVFQPLLYQVATAALAPSDIATATRTLLARQGNVTTLLDDVTGVDDDAHEVLTASGERVYYDYLILATGCSYSFFGNDRWADYALVVKTLADALSIRERLLSAFERAERSLHAEEVASLLTFVVIGGGPTGVEMAGAIAELAKTAVTRDFRNIANKPLRIVLVEAGQAILSAFPDDLPDYASSALDRLGVEVMLNARVRSIDEKGLQIGDNRIDAATVIWAAGTRANEAAGWLGTDAAPNGAVRVRPDCSVEGRSQIFAIGDVASFIGEDGKPLPGLASVAKQQGRYVADVIWSRVQGEEASTPFRYRNWGSMAVIGRSHAVADFGTVRLRGYVAWFSWSLVHLMLLVDFRSRLTVYVNWAWSWFTRGRGVRLLTGAMYSPSDKKVIDSPLAPEG